MIVCATGVCWVVESPVVERGVLTAPGPVWDAASRRAEVIGRLAEKSAVGLASADEAAIELGISRRQVYVLVGRWRAGEGVVSDLLPGRSSGGRGAGRLPDEVEAVVWEVLRTRFLTRQRRTGLLPTTVDAERVQTALARQGTVTETGWAHLLRLVSGSRLVDIFTDPDVARLGVGLVIATEDAHNAADVLTAFDTTTTALVGVYTAQAASAIIQADPVKQDGTAPVWTGLHCGLVDTTAAVMTVRRVSDRAEQHDAKQTELTARREEDRGLLGALTTLLADCPAGHLDSLSSRLDDLDETLSGIAPAVPGLRVDDVAKAWTCSGRLTARDEQVAALKVARQEYFARRRTSARRTPEPFELLAAAVPGMFHRFPGNGLGTSSDSLTRARTHPIHNGGITCAS